MILLGDSGESFTETPAKENAIANAVHLIREDDNFGDLRDLGVRRNSVEPLHRRLQVTVCNDQVSGFQQKIESSGLEVNHTHRCSSDQGHPAGVTFVCKISSS